MVVSPEHPILDKYKDEIGNWSDIEAYREQAAKKSDFERSELAKDKTGVCIDGLTAINPVNGKEIPIYVSDYVLMSYGNRCYHGGFLHMMTETGNLQRSSDFHSSRLLQRMARK